MNSKPGRAVWMDIHRDIKAPEDVTAFVNWCRRHGVTLAFPCVNHITGFMTYASDVTARACGVETWGPTAAVVRQCREAGIETHAWVCIACWGPPRLDAGRLSVDGPRTLHETHPGWFCVNHTGENMLDMDVPFAFLNLALPEVRAFHVRLCEEILGRYEFDGYHLDYIRFQFKPAETMSQPKEAFRGGDETIVPLDGTDRYSFDEPTLQAFQKETGVVMADGQADLAARVHWLYGHDGARERREAWYTWKASKVTALVGDLRDVAHRFGRRLSGAVFSGFPWCGQEVAQRWPAWVDHRLMDVVAPMDYDVELDGYVAHLEAQNAALRVKPAATPMISGVCDTTFKGLSAQAAAAKLERYEELAMAHGRGGICLYCYGSFRQLLPS